MSVWFEGQIEIDRDIQHVTRALDDLGKLYAGVVALMPGLSTVELVEQGTDSVTIKTNEGLMKRTGIAKRFETDRVVVEFDEEYAAGSRLTTTAHFADEFTKSDAGVTHRLVISAIDAPGLFGFFYRTFGSSKTGNAFLKAYKAYLENENG